MQREVVENKKKRFDACPEPLAIQFCTDLAQSIPCFFWSKTWCTTAFKLHIETILVVILIFFS